jgi:cytochrome bd-type quinol oxidase subunit 2
MASPTPKQQKTFALIRIIGGFAAALVLGYSFVVNVLAGQPVEGALMTGLMAFVGLAYAAYYTRTLSRLAKAEQDAAKS